MPLLPSLAALSALAAIQAHWAELKPWRFYVLKPLTTLLILAIAGTAPPSPYRNRLLGGLALSLVGDVCLMFEGEGPFLGGLGSFLVAHLAFIWAFIGAAPAGSPPLWTLGLLAYALPFFGWLLPKTGSLKGPVLVYGLVLLGMALAAARGHHAVSSPRTVRALAGALLFVVSDSALALRQFGGPYRGAQPLVLSTYWAAIGCLAASGYGA